MKKLLFLIIAISLIFSIACKKGKDEAKDVSLGKKYAKYRVSVFKDTDLKTWLATLEKAEDVSLLDYKSDEKNTSSKDILKIKLADDSIGFIESKHLAEKPIVFTEDTKAFVRPTSGSSLYATIPKGELGFIIDEKATWKQVYIGKVNDKNITQQWVEGGYTADLQTVLEAKQFASSVDSINDKDPGKAAHAKEVLETLSNGTGLIADLAKKKLNDLGIAGDDETDIENDIEFSEEETDE